MKKSLFIISVLLLAVTCKKDDKNEKSINTDGQSYRVKQITEKFIFGIADVSDITYNSDKITGIAIKRKDLFGNWKDKFKTEFTYDNDLVTSLFYNNIADKWTLTDKNVYKIVNDLVVEETYFYYEDDVLVENDRWEYKYTDSNLIAYDWYTITDEETTLYEKGEYTYQDNKLAFFKAFQFSEYKTWTPFFIDTFLYQNNNLTGWDRYITNEDEIRFPYYSVDYTYTDNKITEATRYSMNSETYEMEPYYSTVYQYDENDNLTKTEDSDGYSSENIYETGKGNLWIFYPVLDPYLLNYGEPQLKSSSGKRKHIPYHERLRNWYVFRK